ncbi:xylose isomerase [Superficieibacter electus]|uniref:Xylose isomerase n=1 Tax=Superficieibacter electus TaxID=2022662 RepID=A0A2P5GPP9_9ENTR|nr:xylose isomerase [Superficieibacter electus]POP45251.1 xylose isomerase [Superficieibacter electus]POP48535.1 xylose isomerase [Superficieibacter electus]
MSRKIFVVTAAYGHDRVRQAGGQCAMLPVIAAAGADGVEIRREMFNEQEQTDLAALAVAITEHQLLACYSAPEPLYLADGALNPLLPDLLREARTLNALWLKVSLGHFTDSQTLQTLRSWLATGGVRLVVENDQTACGQLPPMQRFSAACQVQDLPVMLTFDMGNWLWVDSSPEQAARHLAPFVSYIHVKAATPQQNGYRAIAPDEGGSRWQALLRALPGDVPRGIEFPLEGDDLTAVTRRYVELLREEEA